MLQGLFPSCGPVIRCPHMSYTESYECDVCGNKKGERDLWWLSFADCIPGSSPDDTIPVIKFSRFDVSHSHDKTVKHLCGAQCAATLMNRWMSDQHEDPDQHCAR